VWYKRYKRSSQRAAESVMSVPDEQSPWVVKGVPELTRRTVKGYAALHHLTMAQAVQLLVSRGLAVGIAPTNEPAFGVLRDMPNKLLAELVRRVAEETERRRAMPPEERLAEEAERQRALEQDHPSAGDVDVRKMMLEFLRETEE
jgi:hypothetical protein